MTQTLISKVYIAFILALALHASTLRAQGNDQTWVDTTIRVHFDPNHPVRRFTPNTVFGAGIDGQEADKSNPQLSPDNITAMLSAGLRPLAYRLRTELADEAWHWNPRGTWSDAAHQQGYWTSDSHVTEPIQTSYGYRLPRRGNTIDQANDDGYSRIDDGDADTFWKSNPYLDEYYAGSSLPLMPQWIVVDLGTAKDINAIKIQWAIPFATHYTIEYGEGAAGNDPDAELPNQWRTFPQGKVINSPGSRQLQKLAQRSVRTRFIRILLNKSSRTGPSNSQDIRDRLGYAIREIYLGVINTHGKFVDVMQHGVTQESQSRIYVSSTDTWHRVTDRDANIEQPGLDFILNSKLTNGLATLIPVPVLYDTPENAAAEIQYLTARGYPLDRIELGEEPDGQFVSPEHYGALYLQFSKALLAINPKLQLGGPSLQDIEQSQLPGHIELGKAGWLGQFLHYLQQQHQLSSYSFFSFEWYPFGDDCEAETQLINSTQMLTDALHEMQLGGLTHNIPWIISEYGYSAFGARIELDIGGALFNADSAAHFLALGGDTSYLYGYEPNQIIREQKCSVGNNMLFFSDQNSQIKYRSATYWGARLLTQEWLKPGNDIHELYAAESDARADNKQQLVTTYAVRRSDGLWSVLLINKDPHHRYRVHVEFQNSATHTTSSLAGAVEMLQYSQAQYALNSDPNNPYPLIDEPPAHLQFVAAESATIILPAYSMSVLRGMDAR